MIEENPFQSGKGIDEAALLERRASADPGQIAMIAGAIGNFLAVLNSGSIVLIDDPGAAIRPMYVPVFLLMIAIGTALYTTPYAILALWRRRLVRGAIGLVLGLTPLFVGLFSFWAIVEGFGYILKD